MYACANLIHVHLLSRLMGCVPPTINANVVMVIRQSS
jgi:hypothetical protein